MGKLGLPMPLALMSGARGRGLLRALNALITGLGVVPSLLRWAVSKIFRGAGWAVSSSTAVYVPEELNVDRLLSILATEPKPSWLQVAPGVWLVLGLSVFLALALRYSLLGRYIYAIGSNEATARLCGINVPLVKLAVYVLAGLATGLAGVMQYIFLNATGDPVTADGLELQVIAAVVIGGGSLNGVRGPSRVP